MYIHDIGQNHLSQATSMKLGLYYSSKIFNISKVLRVLRFVFYKAENKIYSMHSDSVTETENSIKCTR